MERRKIPTLPDREERTYRAKMGLEEGNTVTGYAAVFNKESEDMGWFTEMRELIMPGAFDDADMSDVRALFNHDPNLLLARTSSGTLDLSLDKNGLKYTFEIPDTQAGRDLRELLKRGDISQSSFGFTIAKQSWDEEKDERGETIRVTRKIEKVARLYDVSPVTYPAYPDASVALRSLKEWKEENEKDMPDDVPDEPNDPPFIANAFKICADQIHSL